MLTSKPWIWNSPMINEVIWYEIHCVSESVCFNLCYASCRVDRGKFPLFYNPYKGYCGFFLSLAIINNVGQPWGWLVQRKKERTITRMIWQVRNRKECWGTARLKDNIEAFRSTAHNISFQWLQNTERQKDAQSIFIWTSYFIRDLNIIHKEASPVTCDLWSVFFCKIIRIVRAFSLVNSCV